MIEKIKNFKYIEVVAALLLTLIFFIFFNIFFQLKYEQIDDFTMMSIISSADGNYSLYAIFIHPVICGIIILLYKTGICLNWYSIFMLLIQFISFCTIGTFLIKKHKIKGILLYIIFMIFFYSKLMYNLQFTSIAAISEIAGIIAIIHKREKASIWGIILIAIGAMIRFKTIFLTIPYLVIYFAYISIKNKKIYNVKTWIALTLVILLVYISNSIFYALMPRTKEYSEFNNARSYLHDFVNPYKEKDIFQQEGWTENDMEVFYTFSYADESFYNYPTLKNIEDKIKANSRVDLLKKIGSTVTIFLSEVLDNNSYLYIVILIIILTIYSIIDSKDNGTLSALLLIMTFGMHIGLIYLGRSIFRVVIPEYIIGCLLLIYLLPLSYKTFKDKLLLTTFIIAITIAAIFNIATIHKYNLDRYSKIRETIEYTNSHKENAYICTLSLHRRVLAYTVYEKIPDNTFSNLRAMGDWDTYAPNYYEFKERYDIDNIMTDLYQKDNLYLICGDINWGGAIYKNYIDKIVEYIKTHYNTNVEYEVIKEFNDQIKIYKLKEI